MGTRETGEFPARLEGTRRRFERWRRTRKIGTRIPESLWASAVTAAGTYGVSRTSSVLGVDYYSLKERLAKQAIPSPDVPELGGVPPFVELAAAPPRTMSGECILELEDAGGAKMRVHLKGFEAPDLAALTQSFRSVES